MTEQTGTKSRPKLGMTAVVVGAVAGAIGGVMMAPRSGKETRSRIKNKYNNTEKKALDKVKKTTDSVKDKTVEVTEKVGKAADVIHNKADTTVDRIKDSSKPA